jgi:hypothetical protein
MDPSSPASSRKRDRGEDEPESSQEMMLGTGEEFEAIEDNPFPQDEDEVVVGDSDESEGEDLFGDQLDR